MSFVDADIEDVVTDGAADTDVDLVVDDDTSTDGLVGDDITPDDDVLSDQPDLHTIKWKGADRRVTYDELVNLAQQGEDYTQKSQALAQERDAAATWRAIETSFAKDPKGTLEFLAETFGAAEVVDTTDMDPLERQVLEMQNGLRAMQEAERVRAIDAELATVKQTFNDPDLDDQALLLFAYENGIKTLDVAYRAMKFEERTGATSAAALAEGQRQAKIAAKRTAPVVAGGAKRAAGTTTPGASDDLSVREAFLEAIREHGSPWA